MLKNPAAGHSKIEPDEWAELQIHNNGSTDDKFCSFATVYITATIYGCDCDYLGIGGVEETFQMKMEMSTSNLIAQ